MAIEYHIVGKSIYKNTAWYYCSDEFTGRGIDKEGNIIIGNIKKQLSTSGNGGESNNANGIIEFNDVVNYIETRSTAYNTLKEYEVYVDNIYKTTNTIESAHYSSEGFFIDLTNIKYDKFLLKQNNQYYTFNNSEIVLSPSQELTEDNFTVNGFNSPESITEEQWNNAFPDKTDVKLLAWTDDMDKTEIKAECEIEPYIPYDKLDNEFEICMAMDKE